MPVMKIKIDEVAIEIKTFTSIEVVGIEEGTVAIRMLDQPMGLENPIVLREGEEMKIEISRLIPSEPQDD